MIKKILSIPAKALLITSLVLCLFSVFALRSNNQHMIDLRTKVYQADENGQGVEQALKNLRVYVYSHMNTNLSSGGNTIKPPIQLSHTYQRLVDEANAKAQSENSKIYTDAQNYCQKLNSTDFSGRNRVPCVTEYVSSHGVTIPEIPAGLYKFDFVSPTWSPDLAGFLVVLTAVSLLILLANFLYRRFAKQNPGQ